MIIKILSLVLAILNFISIVLLASIVGRFKQELGKAIQIALFILFVLFARSILRVTNIVPLEYVETTNVIMNSLITILILIAAIYLSKMVKRVDRKTKN